jgi:Ser/Thr protein kinase RdoA (MazF antagonist)
MVKPPPRQARLVLVDPTGTLLGALPPLAVDSPWWQDVAPVVAAVRARHGIEVTVLRMLRVELGPVAQVTYLGEVEGPAPAAAQPWEGRLDDHPLRHPYARPGGPAADLAWAHGVLTERGLAPLGPPAQVRTWNLSSLWRIPLAGQTAWLKAVPPFYAHEGPLLAALAGGPVPTVLGHERGRTLMAEVPGEDLYGAELPQLLAMVDLLVGLQQAWAGRTDELLALGLPDWRGPALGPAIAHVVEATAAELAAPDRALLDEFVEHLPGRFAQIAACGLPDTLVHGDFHAGNVRGVGLDLTLLDWGDSGVGHPLLDQSAFLDRIPKASVEPVREHWLAAWAAAVPGSDPARASGLLAPIAAARQAVIYRGFLDRIEPSEHPYHQHDPADWLTRTAALLHASRAAL